MSGNKFENQVQQKMEELRLQPSAQVWNEVERRIREKKRRRALVFWFLFAGLLLSGSGWWMMTQQRQNTVATIAEKKNINKENNEILKSEQQNKIDDRINNDRNTTTEQITNVPSPETNKPVTTGKNERNTKMVAGNNNSILSAKTKKINDDITIKAKTPGIEKDKNDIAADIPGIVKAGEDNLKKQDDPKTEPAIKFNDVQDELTVKEKNKEESKEETDSTLIKKESNEPITKKSDKHKNKWETSLSFNIGNTRLTDGKIGYFGQKSLDAYSAPSPVTGGSNPPIGYADSIPLKGTALQVGVSAKRKLGKKTAFSIGLGFSYYSTKQQTGPFKDSVLIVNNNLRTLTANGFYRAGNYETYHNRYFYLQIPVLFHWQINKGNKLPLEWENGLTPSVLIASNAVVYDRYSRIFYKDKRVFNSFSLVYQSSFSGRLFKDRKHPVTAGIFYSYHLSRLQKIAPPNYNYLSSYGIRLNWILKK